MKLSEFKIGRSFFLTAADGTHEYRTTDVGTRVVVAIRVDRILLSRRRRMTRAEAEAEGWLRGPPYALREQVFDENDLGACCASAEETF